MFNSFTKAAFRLPMSLADGTTLATVTRAVEFLAIDNNHEDLKASFAALGAALETIFPAEGPIDLDGFLELFDDPAHPSFGCEIRTHAPDATGLCAVTFSGEQVQVEAIAWLIFTFCKSALPCAFEWARVADRPRVGEFGGGCVIITEAGVEHHSTRAILDRAIKREIGGPDEGVDGFVLAIADREHGLSFRNNDHGFGRLALATVFSEDDARHFDKPVAHAEPEWLAMPAPLDCS